MGSATVLLEKMIKPDTARSIQEYSSEFNLTWIIENLILKDPDPNKQTKSFKAYHEMLANLLIQPERPPLPRVFSDTVRGRAEARKIPEKGGRPIDLMKKMDFIMITEKTEWLIGLLNNINEIYNASIRNNADLFPNGIPVIAAHTSKPFPIVIDIESIKQYALELEEAIDIARHVLTPEIVMKTKFIRKMNRNLIRSGKLVEETQTDDRLRLIQEQLIEAVQPKLQELEIAVRVSQKTLDNQIKPWIKIVVEWDETIKKYNLKLKFYLKILPEELDTVRYIYWASKELENDNRNPERSYSWI